MLETMVQNQIIFYVMGILLVLAVTARVVCAFTIRRMVKAAGRIHKSNHKLMKLVKAKFEHACMVSDRVENVEAFVDKYIYEYRICGIRLGGLRSFPKKLLWVTVVLGLVALFECYRMDGFGEAFTRYAQWTGVLVSLLVLLSYVSEDTVQLAAAKNYMVEYLENVCAHRYGKVGRLSAEANAQAGEQTEDDQTTDTAGVEEKAAEKVADILAESTEATPVGEAIEASPGVSAREEKEKSEQEMRIRAILEEFLA